MVPSTNPVPAANDTLSDERRLMSLPAADAKMPCTPMDELLMQAD